MPLWHGLAWACYYGIVVAVVLLYIVSKKFHLPSGKQHFALVNEMRIHVYRYLLCFLSFTLLEMINTVDFLVVK